jgi:hypothetical protein
LKRLELFSYVEKWWLALVAIGVSFAILLSEPRIIDFFQRGHVNWVSLDSLAIANHSSFAHGGVGYGCKELDGLTGDRYEYFNRYPMFFAVLSRLVLQPFLGDAASWLYAARQWMNMIFIATGFALWWMLRSLRFSRVVAIASVLLTLSAPVVLEYRSMFHFDQPALLAYALLLLVVVRQLVKPAPKLRWYLGVLFLGAMTGRSAVVLIFSLVLPLILVALKPFPFDRGSLAGVRALRGVWFGVPLAFGSVFVATAYNVVWEARLNRVSWQDTSVVQSALRRLGFVDIPGSAVERTRWLGGAIPKIASYLSEYSSPLLVVVALLILICWVTHRQRNSVRLFQNASISSLSVDEKQRRSLMLWGTGLTSLLWIVVMKNLFVFHIYAGMVVLPFLLLCMAFALETLIAQVNIVGVATPGRIDRALIVASCSVFFIVLFFGPGAQLRPDAARRFELEGFFAELTQYRNGLRPGDMVWRDSEWLPRSPTAQCALLDVPLLVGDHSEGIKISEPPRFPERPR